jgi:hypothetical protein
MGKQSDVVDIGGLRFAAPEAVGELERRETDPELMLERPAEPEIGRQ